MAKIKLTKVPFNGTEEQSAKLDAVLAELVDVPGGLMPALQRAQLIYGYLPIEVQSRIADAFDVSLEEVFGISTFYSLFTLNPKGKNEVSICLGTACYVKGAGALLDELVDKLGIPAGETTKDGKFSLVETRCVGCCGLAPVVTINGDVYGKLVPEQLEEILAKYN